MEIYDDTKNHCPLVGRERLMEISSVTSQIYQWLKGHVDRKPRTLKTLSVSLVAQAVTVILRYPHLGGKKGRIFMLYHGLAVIADHTYQWIKTAVMWCIQGEVRSRKLLPRQCTYVHKPPVAVGDVWSADFTHVVVCGVLVFLSVVRDNKSLFTLGSEACLGAGTELVLAPLHEALALTDGKGPKEFQLTDRGSQYRSEAYSEALGKAGIKHVLVPPREPWYNGVCENGMKTLQHHFYRRWHSQKNLPAAGNKPEILARVKACLAEVVNELNTVMPCPSLKGVTPHDVYFGTADARRQEIQAYEVEEKTQMKEKESEVDGIDRKDVPKLVRGLVQAPEIRKDELVVLWLLLGGKPMRWLNRVCPEGVG